MSPRRVRREPEHIKRQGPARRGATIIIDTSLAVDAHLQRLVDTGLYGTRVSEAAERVLCEALSRHHLIQPDAKL